MDREHDATRQTWSTPQLRTADAATTELTEGPASDGSFLSSFASSFV